MNCGHEQCRLGSFLWGTISPKYNRQADRVLARGGWAINTEHNDCLMGPSPCKLNHPNGRATLHVEGAQQTFYSTASSSYSFPSGGFVQHSDHPRHHQGHLWNGCFWGTLRKTDRVGLRTDRERNVRG